MVSTKSIVTLLIALVIAITLFQPVVSTVNTSTGTQTVTNESVTADNETYVDLQGYDIDQSETVYWNNTTSNSWEVVSEGTDYDMNYSAGSIRALDSGPVDTGDELKVTYDYQATDGTTATVAAIVPTLMALLMIGVMANKIQGAM